MTDADLLRAAIASAGETHVGFGRLLGMDGPAVRRVLAGTRALDRRTQRVLRVGLAHPVLWRWLRALGARA